MASKVVHLDGHQVGVDAGKKDEEGKVVVEAIECPRKGTLNGQPIHRSELEPGDDILFAGDSFIATRKK